MVTREQLGTSPVHRLFDLHQQDESECNHVALFDTDQPEPVADSGRLARAAWKALSLVRPTRSTDGEGSPAVYSDEHFEGESILKPEKVDTRVLDKQFFSQAREEGVWNWGFYLMIYMTPQALTLFEQGPFEGSNGSCMQLQRQRPPGYILENVSPLAHRPGTKIRDEVLPYIASVIGRPVSFDAARA
eukprot:gene34636-biopygen34695